MRYLKFLALLGICLMAAPHAHAQRVVVGIGVGPAYVGPPPVCDYGYYGYYPYACAPYGYYGPSYFSGGVFIGTGPWFRGYYGRPGFYGGSRYYGRHDFDDRGYRHFGRGHDDDGFRGGYGRGGRERGDFRGWHERGDHEGRDLHGGGGFHSGGRR